MGCGASVQQQQADNQQATAQEPAAAPAAIVPPPAAASVGKPELARLELDADPVEEEHGEEPTPPAWILGGFGSPTAGSAASPSALGTVSLRGTKSMARNGSAMFMSTPELNARGGGTASDGAGGAAGGLRSTSFKSSPRKRREIDAFNALPEGQIAPVQQFADSDRPISPESPVSSSLSFMAPTSVDPTPLVRRVSEHMELGARARDGDGDSGGDEPQEPPPQQQQGGRPGSPVITPPSKAPADADEDGVDDAAKERRDDATGVKREEAGTEVPEGAPEGSQVQQATLVSS